APQSRRTGPYNRYGPYDWNRWGPYNRNPYYWPGYAWPVPTVIYNPGYGVQATQPVMVPMPMMLNSTPNMLDPAQLQVLTQLAMAQCPPTQPNRVTPAQVDSAPEVSPLTADGPSQLPSLKNNVGAPEAPAPSRPQVDVASRPPSLTSLK